jgi:hypothetical protein
MKSVTSQPDGASDTDQMAQKAVAGPGSEIPAGCQGAQAAQHPVRAAPAGQAPLCQARGSRWGQGAQSVLPYLVESRQSWPPGSPEDT